MAMCQFSLATVLLELGVFITGYPVIRVPRKAGYLVSWVLVFPAHVSGRFIRVLGYRVSGLSDRATRANLKLFVDTTIENENC